MVSAKLVYAKGVYASYALLAVDETSTLFGEITTFYDDEKMRMEIALNNGQEDLEKIVHIVDAKNKKSYMLFENSKTYVQFKYPKLKTKSHEKKYKPSNETKTIAGFSCEVFGKIKKDYVETVCVSEELYKKYQKFMDSFKQLGQKQSYYLKDIEGFPLEYQATVDGKTLSKLKLQDLKEKNIQPKMFDLPKTYKKVESIKKKISDNNTKKINLS
ncbi:MAG TPA: DUF4412 domain-containing protein [Oligoflexia bacterium]|nr:DUF4412 domain-containing protein [Oligoflexia bacterium]